MRIEGWAMHDSNSPSKTVPLWTWLFPTTYVAHIAEEYWGGPGFPAWVSQFANIPLSVELFLWLNAVGLAGMIICVLIARTNPGTAGLLICLATVELVNGILHTVLSVLTASYSPGAVTGLLLWVPLGMAGLSRLRRPAGPGFWPGIAAGLAFHAVLSGSILFRG